MGKHKPISVSLPPELVARLRKQFGNLHTIEEFCVAYIDYCLTELEQHNDPEYRRQQSELRSQYWQGCFDRMASKRPQNIKRPHECRNDADILEAVRSYMG